MLDQCAEKIETETGLAFSGRKKRDLRQAVRRIADDVGAENEAECIEWLLRSPWDKAKSDLCARHLTIGETYFFRETRAFELVRDYAREKMTALGARHTSLRIWSAGCCSGEEAYSIAMTLRQSVPQIPASQISILGTDINPDFLQTARAGVYRRWSFRNTDSALQAAYFAPTRDGQYRLNDEIGNMVRFSELNLALPAYPSIATNTQGMDIIFCRNVLMYFSKAQARQVIQRLWQCLVDGGWLVVSPSEASAELFKGFDGVYYPDAIFFRKTAPAALRATKRLGLPEPGRHDDKILLMPALRQHETHKAKTRTPTRIVRESAEAPAAAEDFHARALTAMESGRHAEAMQNLKRMLYLQPDSVMAHYLMGITHSAQGDRHAANRLFDATCKLLNSLADDEIVSQSDGLTAAYLRASVRAFREAGNR
ncbi:CheR family methyltransferase [Paucimonas lemoignei]|nr:CheR family methyltransferase [Paucimonas lemoignei]